MVVSPTSLWRHRRYLIILALFLACVVYLFYFGYLDSWIRPARLHWLSAQTIPSLIPRNIWQILLPMPDSVHATGISDARARSWLVMNPDYTYTRLSTDGATNFLERHYPDRPDYLETFHALQNPALKSDFLRYLILLAEGGVYSDMDTTALQPVNDWIPEEFRTRAKVIAGIEWDQRDEQELREVFAYPVQFQQWTLAAVPHHPIFESLVEHVLNSLQGHVQQYGTTLDKLKLSDMEILRATGPAAWTGAVWSYIEGHESDLTSLRNLSYMTEPTLYGDVLVFPINGFGSGQDHSGSAQWFTPKDGLVKHHFKGSWRIHQ